MSTILGPDQAEGLRRMMGDLPESKTKIIAVTSGKGGVGKSNFAVNLGIMLANMTDPQAKNNQKKRVIVMDADLGLANVNVLLGIIPKYNLFHVMKGQKKSERDHPQDGLRASRSSPARPDSASSQTSPKRTSKTSSTVSRRS
jgi:cellulose biosynthesis protein BcsQ